MIEGSGAGSGSIPRTYWSGSGSTRQKTYGSGSGSETLLFIIQKNKYPNSEILKVEPGSVQEPQIWLKFRSHLRWGTEQILLVKTTMVYSQDWGSKMSPMNSVRAASLHTNRSSAFRGLPVRSHLGNKEGNPDICASLNFSSKKYPLPYMYSVVGFKLGTAFPSRIRIQPTKNNTDQCGSGYIPVTLVILYINTYTLTLVVQVAKFRYGVLYSR